MTDFGELKSVDVREIWNNEATDFTPWLVDNIDKLGEALGMELEVREREADVGDFSLDILAKDLGSGRAVIIENQLEATDHDHLGKLLTYAGGFDAGVLVWIATDLRDEHRQALEWLNEHTGRDIDCFGVVIEVIKIDNSKPAYHFKPVVFPNEWQKDWNRGTTTKSPKAEAYRNYFQALIDELRTKHKFTGAKIGQPQNWYSFSSGVPGIIFSNVFVQGGKIRAEVYIDFQDKEKNKILFDKLHQNKEVIEQDFGNELSWERLDDRRASRIGIYRDGSIDLSSETLDELRKWSIEKLLHLKKIMLPRIESLMVSQ
ncbi:MAG: DUF4268 domain-containing protein [Candidatus Omnitrophica bacterium]|nr:DUF4268 domain-containing protein [Candidatus Omnitrophota bacterium]